MRPPEDERAAADDDMPEIEPLSDKRLALIELDGLLNRPPSWRKRLLYSGLVIVALAVALTTFWNTLLPKPASAPADPLLTGMLLSNVTYGAVTVNGQKQSGPPPLGIILHKNALNIITLNAPPFAPLTCKITFPTTYDDSGHCVLHTDELVAPDGPPIFVNNGMFHPTFFISIGFSWYDLNQVQEGQALSALNQTLGAPQQISVPVGSYYAVSSAANATFAITSQRASAPLLASASLILQPDYMTVCGAAPCPDPLSPGQSAALSGQVWVINFSAEVRWQFIDTSGITVGDNSYPSPNTDAIRAAFSYEPSAGWVIATQDMPNTLQNQLEKLLCPIGIALLPPLIGYSLNTQIIHDAGIEGCLFRAQTDQGKQGLFLWRFGVLLAADDGAHAMQPALPIAPPEEIAAVGG